MTVKVYFEEGPSEITYYDTAGNSHSHIYGGNLATEFVNRVRIVYGNVKMVNVNFQGVADSENDFNNQGEYMPKVKINKIVIKNPTYDYEEEPAFVSMSLNMPNRYNLMLPHIQEFKTILLILTNIINP
jgi:hypothetical protein